MRIIRLLLAFGLPAWVGAAEAPAGPVPVELLFVNHESSQMQVSPDGKYLASIFVREQEKPRKRWTALAAFRIDDRKPVPLLDRENVNVENFWWVGDNRLLVAYWNFNGWGLFSCNPDGSDFVALVDPAKTDYNDPRILLLQCEVLHTQTGQPDEVLVARRNYAEAEEKWLSRATDHFENSRGAYILNVRTGKYRLVAKDPAYTHDWVVTKAGRPRVAITWPKEAFSRRGQLVDKTRVPESGVFWIDDHGTAEAVGGILTGEDEDFRAIGLNGDETGLLFHSRQGRDKGAVYLYRRSTRAIEGPLLEAGEAEADQFRRSALDQTPASLVFPEPKPRVHYFDARLATMQKGIDEVLPEFVNQFISWDREMARLLIASTSPTEPGRYYLFDRVAGKLEMVFQRTPWLRGWKLGTTEAVSIVARDGLKMQALLTRPPGAAPGTPKPMVLLVHGGPWGNRDQFEYDPERAFYATRGYVVLQVNFRGSAGYGRAVEQGSFGQFGRAMQDDLNDAVAWAVAQGVADPACVVIAGNSYGGYAALRGATRDPGLYRAVITGFAPANMTKVFEHYRNGNDMQRYHYWARRVADPEKDAALLREISPVNWLQRLRVPVFVLFGDDDEIVDYGQSKELVKTLRELRKKYSVFAPPNQGEGHGFNRKENRFKAYTEIEKFLAVHAPAR